MGHRAMTDFLAALAPGYIRRSRARHRRGEDCEKTEVSMASLV
jgi:hypothetical protein